MVLQQLAVVFSSVSALLRMAKRNGSRQFSFGYAYLFVSTGSRVIHPNPRLWCYAQGCGRRHKTSRARAAANHGRPLPAASALPAHRRQTNAPSAVGWRAALMTCAKTNVVLIQGSKSKDMSRSSSEPMSRLSAQSSKLSTWNGFVQDRGQQHGRPRTPKAMNDAHF